MKLAALAGAMLAALGATAATANVAARAPVPGVLWTIPGGPRLAKLDPMTLAPVDAKRVLIGGTRLLATSRDGSRIVLGGGSSAAIRVVDLDAMRLVGTLWLGAGQTVAALWTLPDRVLAILTKLERESELVVFDPRTMRLRERRSLSGPVLQAGATDNRLVALIGRSDGMGPTRIAVVDTAGRARFADLPSIRAGFSLDEQSGVVHQESPGLAVDPTGRRAAVVAGDGTVAEIDLGTLAVSTHQPQLRNTAARRKVFEGWSRTAVWISDSLLAVSGWNAQVLAPERDEQRTDPSGLSLIDTHTWRVVAAEPNVGAIARAGGVLLAYGEDGLRGYAADGTTRFHLLDGEPIGAVQIAGGLVYVGGCDGRCFRVVDPAVGRLIAKTTTKVPTSLLG
jgi:hypothetical protein